jgi:hypothetical protein
MCRTIWFLWRPLPGDGAHDSPYQGHSGLALLVKARLRKVLDQPGFAERACRLFLAEPVGTDAGRDSDVP